MGNSHSSKRMDRYYGNYEKSFERVGKDMERVKVRQAARGDLIVAEPRAAPTPFCVAAHVRRASWGLGPAEDQALGCGALC